MPPRPRRPAGVAGMHVRSLVAVSAVALTTLAPGRASAQVAPPPEPEKDPAPVEVTVRGDRPPPASTTVPRSDVRLTPGAFGDPFRAIESLPGVTPLASGVPFFYVRGAPPGDVGYFLDGVRVPLLYHIGLGPSVVHPAIVEHVDLHPGGYPARFGRFAGGIVAGETRPPSDRVWGEGSIRLIDAGAIVEAPFADGRGAALLGGRYSYTAALLSLLSPDVSLDYWDYQGRVGFDVSRRDRVSAFFFGSYDYLGEVENDGSVSTLFETTFHRLDLRWDHRSMGGTRVRHAVTLGFDETRPEQAALRDYLVGARVEVDHPLAKDASLRFGVDGSTDTYEIALDEDGRDDEDFEAIFTRRDLAAGMWADLVVRPDPVVEIVPGVRVDVFGSAGAAAASVDPRLALRFFVGDDVRIVHAFGVAHQPPSFVVPIPGFAIGGLRGGLQSAVQLSSSVEADFPENVSGSLTVFRNALFDLSDQLALPTDGDFDRDTRVRGDTIGLEVYVKRRLTRRVGGFVAYTLSRSRRTGDVFSLPSSFDRTHVASVAVSVDLGRRWRAGTRAAFYTGRPTPATAQLFGYDERFPAFFRLDARLEKRWVIGETGWVSFVIEGQNVTLSKEALDVECSESGCEQTVIGPVTIPSLGVEGGF